MKILPTDMLSTHGPDTVGISDFSITYTQDADTNSEPDERQFITFSAVPSASCEEYREGGEPSAYYNIKIKDCDHWSIGSAEDLVALFDDFKRRYSMVTT